MVQMSRSHQGIVQKQFTKTADAFTEFAVRDEPEVLAEKLEFVKPQHTDFSLDVACGPGAFVLALAPRVRFVRGLDLTEELLRRARQLQLEHNILNAAFDRGEAEQLPYPSAVFDLVTCQCALHHMSTPAVALREIVRVMKAEGRLAVIDTLSPESDPKFELHNLIERTRDPSHTLALRLTTFLEIFENLGLEIAHQSLRRRQRLFNQWMLRAGLKPGHRRYRETRKLLEDSIPGDRASYSPRVEDDDISMVHHEGMFLLVGGRR
jgi:ubiquinone/menaquinone biosynthesis C-methylase UbiE